MSRIGLIAIALALAVAGMLPAAGLAQGVHLDPAAAALTLADLPSGFGLTEERTRTESSGAVSHVAIFENDGSPRMIVNVVLVMPDGSRVADADLARYTATFSDPGYEQAPAEFPGSPVGDATRWLRAQDATARPPINAFTVAFRSGNGAAIVRMTDTTDGKDWPDIAPYAQVVADRLAALAPPSGSTPAARPG